MSELPEIFIMLLCCFQTLIFIWPNLKNHSIHYIGEIIVLQYSKLNVFEGTELIRSKIFIKDKLILSVMWVIICCVKKKRI
jgi:hypothetical protein